MLNTVSLSHATGVLGCMSSLGKLVRQIHFPCLTVACSSARFDFLLGHVDLLQWKSANGPRLSIPLPLCVSLI